MHTLAPMVESEGPRRHVLDDLPTEAWNAGAADLDLRSTRELVDLMNAEDATVPAAVEAAAAQITAAVDAVSEGLRRGGRLIYVGAGTSGRLAALDAAECESTFSTEPGQVVALLAGGPLARATAQEAAEVEAVAGPLGASGGAAGGLGAGAAGAAGGAGVGAFPGAGLTSYTRPTSTFEPETGGRPTGLRAGVFNAAEIRSPTTSAGTGGTAMPIAPAGMAARGSSDNSEKEAVTHARIVVDGDRTEPQ